VTAVSFSSFLMYAAGFGIPYLPHPKPTLPLSLCSYTRNQCAGMVHPKDFFSKLCLGMFCKLWFNLVGLCVGIVVAPGSFVCYISVEFDFIEFLKHFILCFCYTCVWSRMYFIFCLSGTVWLLSSVCVCTQQMSYILLSSFVIYLILIIIV
jgi:hypothetical protein